MPKKMTDKHKYTAYVLNKDFGYTKTRTGEIMGVSQSTISNAVKEIEYRIRTENLKDEFQEAWEALKEKGYTPLVAEVDIPENAKARTGNVLS